MNENGWFIINLLLIPKGLINSYSDLETSIQVNRFLLMTWRKAILNADVLQACEIQVCHRHVDRFAWDTTGKGADLPRSI